MSDNQTGGLSAGELEALKSKKLPELQVIAKSVGVKRVTGVKKQDLVELIKQFSGVGESNESAAPKRQRKRIAERTY
jgi:hypothetical protein